MKINFKEKHINILMAIAGLLFLGLFISGHSGTFSDNQENDTTFVTSPFENSSPRSRYALLYSVVEYNTIYFNNNLSKFASPDLAKNGDRYVSLFAPGVSYIAIPGYILGKLIGIPQVGTFAIVSLFAFFNYILIKVITHKLTDNNTVSWIAALIFTVATPALAYSGTLYQHHITTFLILLSLYALFYMQDRVSLPLVWFLCAISIAVDNPNVFFMFPIGIVALGRIFSIKGLKATAGSSYEVSIKYPLLLSFLAAIIPIALFLNYNYLATGNHLQVSGTLQRVVDFDQEVNHADIALIGSSSTASEEKTAIGFFKTRLTADGAYTHFISADRGLINYSPILVLGLLGIILSYKSIGNRNMYKVLVSIFAIIVLIYSMWGDPWGGWSFGSRYMIPANAILSIFSGILLNKYSKNIPLLCITIVLFYRSTFVSVTGAAVSLNIPPKPEVLMLEQMSGKEEKYTVARLQPYIEANESRSFFYNQTLKNKLSLKVYINTVTYMAVAILTLLLIKLKLKPNVK